MTLFIDRTAFTNRCVAMVLGLSLLMSAFPASFTGFTFAQAAPESVYSASSLSVNEGSQSSTGDVDTTGHTDLQLAFDFDGQGGGTPADGIDSGDTFRYGWRVGTNSATEVELGSVAGADGADPAELGSVSGVSLPAAAAGIPDLQIYFEIDSSGGSDTVAVSNIAITGEPIATACTPDNSVAGPTGIQNTDSTKYFSTIENAILDCATDSGDTITVAAGSYTLPQVTIDKDLSVVGAGRDTVTITPSENTGSSASADSAAWILVEPGTEFNLRGVTLDGDEDTYTIARMITTYGTGVIEDNAFKNIKSTSPYIGMGVTVFGDVTVQNNTFENIARIGVHVRKAYSGSAVGTAEIIGNTFTGQGVGDWVEYGVEIGAASYALVQDNTFSNYKGVAASDGSVSAGILVTDYYGVGTEADIEGNTLDDNSNGVIIGYDTPDATKVTLTQNNIINNTDYGVSALENTDVTAIENWWGDQSGPSGEGAGTGDSVSAFISFSPWLCTEAPSSEITTNGFCGVKTAETVEVTADTYDLSTGTGWLFNRDTNTATPYEFNEDENVIGDGALYVLPIQNNYTGTVCTSGPGCDKFIGELFLLDEISNIEEISYDFQIGSGGASTDANEFYLNVYANYGESDPNKYYDCKYDVVPTVGTVGSFTTVTFDPTQSYPVTTRGGGSASPYTCPAIPADMNDDSPQSTIRMVAINVGDTSTTDLGLDGYYDNVIVDTISKTTTYDFELAQPDLAVPTMSDIKMYVERNGEYEASNVVRPGDMVRVEVEAEDADSGIKDVEFRIQSQDGQYVAGVGRVTTPISGTTYRFEYQVPTDGKYVNTHNPMNIDIDGHRFWARATDNAGNYNHGLDGDFTFDTILPEMSNIKMFVYRGGSYVESNVVEPGDNVRIEVDAADAAGDIRDVEFRIQAQDGQYVALRDYAATPISGTTYRFEYQVPTDGKYVNTHNPMNEDVDGHKFWARATDEAGNYHHGLRGDFTFTTAIDSTKPTVAIDTPDHSATLMTGAVHATGTAADEQTSIKEVKYTVTEVDAIGGTYVANVASGVANGAEAWDFTVMLNDPGFYRLKVQAFDQDGNWKYRYHDIEVVEPPQANLAILTPAMDTQVYGSYEFTAKYEDDDETEDNVQWAVRAGTCAANAAATVAGNVAGYNDSFVWDGEDFTATLDTSLWSNGEYCFVVNPVEGSGETDLRATQTFFVMNNQTCEAGVNLVKNPSFELDVVTASQGWSLFDQISDWVVEKLGGGVAKAELQAGVNGWSSADGNQHVELGSNQQTEWSQTILTKPGETYTLSWQYSARPDTDMPESRMGVYLDGVEIAKPNEHGEDDVNWNTYTHTFVATSSAVTVMFADIGTNNGLGAFLDDVSLECDVPAPPAPETHTISGYKWNDEDGDGNWDETELGLPDWEIELESETGTISTTTDQSGYYEFVVTDGWYAVAEQQQTGWVQTAPAGATDADDSYGFCVYAFGEPVLPEQYTSEDTFLNPVSCDFGNQEIIEDEEPEELPDTDTEQESAGTTGSSNTGGLIGGGTTNSLGDGRVLGASTSSVCPYINESMQIGAPNDRLSVIKLQLFLWLVMGYDNPITGVFDDTTDANVKAFQAQYSAEVLQPWYDAGIVSHTNPTGFVYLTTLWKINDVMCPGMVAFPSLAEETLGRGEVDID